MGGNPAIKSLDEARHHALAENTAQDIFHEIQTLENEPLSEQRWVWELLQNALDACPSGRRVKVRIHWDGAILVFEHNGDTFMADEIAHLIYHGSTKYRDPEKRGKFGRGFLVTHLLSKKVIVHGLERDAEGEYCFDIELDRNGNPDIILEQMDTAWEQLKTSRKPISAGEHEDIYSTRYVYTVDDRGRKSAEAGIEAATRCIPYVLAFASELDEMVLDYCGTSTVWRKDDIYTAPSDPSICFTSVCVTRIPNSSRPAKETSQDSLIVLVKSMTPDSGDDAASVAVMLRRGLPHEVAADELVPRFFAVGLPIVGTEILGLPFVVHSIYFEVEAGRTGIHAGKVKDATPQQVRNWTILTRIPAASAVILRYASQQSFSGLHLLANVTNCPDKDWLDSEKFTQTVLAPVVKEIQTNTEIRLVSTVQGENIPIKDAVIPVDDAEGKLYGLLRNWKPANKLLVAQSLAHYWASVFEDWSKVLSTPLETLTAAWSLKYLAGKVASYKNLKALAQNLDSEEGQSVTDWLNGLIGLLISSPLQHLLMNLALLPDQNGLLHKLSELFLDTGIDEELKEIAEKSGNGIRSKLLHRDIKGIEDKLNKKNEQDVVTELLAKANQLKPELNAKLLAWIASRHLYEGRISGYPVLTLGTPQKLDKDRPLLKPVAKWPHGSTEFSDIFPKDYVIADTYSQALNEECWKSLESGGYVYSSLIYVRDEKDIEKCFLEEVLEEENGETKHEVSLKVTDVCFLEEKDKGLIDTVRHSKQKARKFTRFLFSYLSKVDPSWKNAISSGCSCGKEHRVVPCGWLRVLKERQWVPIVGKKYGTPTAENIFALIDENFLDTMVKDDDAAALLQKLGIGISDLLKVKIADPAERLQADRLAAKMYAQNAGTRSLLSQVLDQPDLQDLARKHLEQQEITRRNRQVGTLVEQLIRQALKAENISVKRTGIGSDYEVQCDFIDNGQEQVLTVGRYLLEVKATSTRDVRMTLTQGNMAINPPPEYSGYILCVCAVTTKALTEAEVRLNSRFVFDIGEAIEELIGKANELVNMESTVKQAGDDRIQLEVSDSSKRLKVSDLLWESGITFDDAIRIFRNQNGDVS